jgi:hypothetical protein
MKPMARLHIVLITARSVKPVLACVKLPPRVVIPDITVMPAAM